jgi:hypothetical protein
VKAIILLLLAGLLVCEEPKPSFEDYVQNMKNFAERKGIPMTPAQVDEVIAHARRMERRHALAIKEYFSGYLVLRITPSDPHTHQDAVLNLDAALESIAAGTTKK